MEEANTTRRARRRSMLERTVAACLVIATVAGVGACSPAPPSLSDPREILGRAVGHLQAARTVHLDLVVDGSLAFGSVVPGAGPGGGSFGLTGTRVEGDLDLAADSAAVRFELPALLGLTGELRQIGSDAYLTSSLTSRGWHRLDAAGLPLGVGRPVGWIDALTAWLDRPAVVPTRLDDVACRAGTCYVVRVTVGQAELAALASAAPAVAAALGEATLTFELRIDRTALTFSEASIAIDLGEAGAVSVTVAFTAWDAAISIEAPPPGDIVDGPLLR